MNSIVTVPADTSRKFILFGNYMRSVGTVAVHLDFSALTSRQCGLAPFIFLICGLLMLLICR